MIGVLSGAVGGSFGPFPRSSTYANYAPGQAPFNRRDSIASSDVAIDVGGGMYVPEMRYSIASLDSDALLGTETFGKEKVMLPPDESLLWDKSKPDVDECVACCIPSYKPVTMLMRIHVLASAIFTIRIQRLNAC